MSNQSTPGFAQTPQPPAVAASTFSPTQTAGIITVLQQIAQNQLLLMAAINNKFPNWVPVPATASSPGVAGDAAYQSGFLYICVSSNVWQRVAIATF